MKNDLPGLQCGGRNLASRLHGPLYLLWCLRAPCAIIDMAVPGVREPGSCDPDQEWRHRAAVYPLLDARPLHREAEGGRVNPYLALLIIIGIILGLRIVWVLIRNRGTGKTEEYAQDAWNKATTLMYGRKEE